jgi:DNA-binding beta-propeller fold protein YncE
MRNAALILCVLAAACGTRPQPTEPGTSAGTSGFDWKNLAAVPNPNPDAPAQPSRMHPFAVAVTQDGKHALVTLRGTEIEPHGEVAVIDLATRQVVKRLEVGHRPVAIVARPQGDFAVVASMYSPFAAVIDLKTFTVAGQLAVDHYAMDFAFDRSGAAMFHTDRKGDTVKRWAVSVVNGTLKAELTHTQPAGNNPMPLGLSPDGSKIYVGDEGGMTVRVYATADLAPAGEIFLNAPIFDIKPMGGWMVVTTLNDTNGLPCEKDGDYPGTQGDGIFPTITDRTCSRGFADVQNEVAIIDPNTDQVAIRYTSDSAELSEIDREGDHLPELMKVQGSLPYSLAVASPTKAYVSMGSSFEVAELTLDGAQPPTPPKLEMNRVFDTGYAPRGLALVPGTDTLVAANLLGESVSVIDTAANTSEEIAVGKVTPAFPATSAEIGELYFHTSKFATDGDISCVHCHPDVENDGKNWNVDVARAFGRRSAMMLRNLHQTKPLLIEGVFDETDFRLEMEGISVRADFHDVSYTLQVSRRDEFYNMKTVEVFGLKRDFHQMSLHIADYLMVEPRLNPSPFDKTTAEVERGKALFFSNEVGCAACHPPPTFASPKLFQGITTLGKFDLPRRDLDPDISVKFVENAVDGAFNANTLRGLWDRKGALFHDGRARTIRETILTPNHKCIRPGERPFNEFGGQVDTNGGISQLTCEQLEELEAFLKTID